MYLISALVLLAIIMAAKISNKWSVPLVVISLLAGILFGSDILGVVYLDNFILSRQMADFALVFVLFIGGFETKKERLQSVFVPSMILATVGVALTAALTGISLHYLLKLDWLTSILIGCVISSTDASTVFSILRSRSLNPKLASVVEIESATNDPMAIVLTSIAIQITISQMQHPANLVLTLLWQITGGILIGLLIGKIAVFLFNYLKTLDKGYFYLYMISIILLSYGVADFFLASGIISAFFAGYFIGNSNIPYKPTISTLLEALSTISNVIIFVLLGLLVFPNEFYNVYKTGIILFLIITFFARPVAVFSCLFFTKYNVKEKIFLSWSGLRGAVPIVLATYLAAANVPGSRGIFNIVFFAVLLSMIIQGTTLVKLADFLKLSVKAKPKPRQVMELITLQNSELELIEITIDENTYTGSALVSSLLLPPGSTITMLNRNENIIAPRGNTKIIAGDILYVLVKTSDIEAITNELLTHFELIEKAHHQAK
ncbi:MAG: potassium/proton antiporter [Candidatus Margulisbacteria bacterium]|nr:potassium/proton antiporter [Candidatus Margulisiibacteriota bacterium]